MSDDVRIRVLEEVLREYKRSAYTFQWWLENEIYHDVGSIPPFQPGEILFFYCTECGRQYLNRDIPHRAAVRNNGTIVSPMLSVTQCKCGSYTYYRLGSNQGYVWKQKTFPSA